MILDKSSEIRRMIETSTRILMHLHPDYDQDSVGSVLAMKYAIGQINPDAKVTVIAGDNHIKKDFAFLPDYDCILEKRFKDISIEDYDLFISLDSSSPQQITDDDSPVFPLSIRSVVIDHHKNNKGYGDVNLVVPEIVATSEILYYLFKDWRIEITHDIAECLFAGIWGDTGGFRWEGTTWETLQVAAELKRNGVDHARMVYLMEALTNRQIRAIGSILSTLKEYYSGNVSIVRISRMSLRKLGLDDEDVGAVLASINPMLSRSSDSTLTVSLKEKVEGQISVSLRNNNLAPDKQCDVSEIAVALNGGGHRRAGGARFYGKTFDEVEEIVLSKVAELHPEFGER